MKSNSMPNSWGNFRFRGSAWLLAVQLMTVAVLLWGCTVRPAVVYVRPPRVVVAASAVSATVALPGVEITANEAPQPRVGVLPDQPAALALSWVN